MDKYEYLGKISEIVAWILRKKYEIAGIIWGFLSFLMVFYGDGPISVNNVFYPDSGYYIKAIMFFPAFVSYTIGKFFAGLIMPKGTFQDVNGELILLFIIFFIGIFISSIVIGFYISRIFKRIINDRRKSIDSQ